MRTLQTGIHPVPAQPLFVESSACLVSSTIAISRLTDLPAMQLEADVLELMQGTLVGDVDVTAVPPEADEVEQRMLRHVSQVYGLGNGRQLEDGEYQSQILWCQGAAFHEDAVFDCVTAVMLWEGEARDLVLPHLGVVVPLTPGTVVLFDSAQPHGLLMPGHRQFDARHYQDPSTRSVFCTMDLPRDLPGLQALMQFECEPRGVRRDAFRLQASTGVDSTTGAWQARKYPVVSAN